MTGSSGQSESRTLSPASSYGLLAPVWQLGKPEIPRTDAVRSAGSVICVYTELEKEESGGPEGARDMGAMVGTSIDAQIADRAE